MGATKRRDGIARQTLGLLVAVVLVVAFVATSIPGAATTTRGRGDARPAVHAKAAAQDRDGMYRLTNASRQHRGIRALDLAAKMSELARRHSRKMVARGEIFHTTDPVSTYLRGRRWRIWGENVGMTSGSLSEMHKMFMNSPPHRHNILDNRFKDVAVGVVRANGAFWVTVFFYG